MGQLMLSGMRKLPHFEGTVYHGTRRNNVGLDLSKVQIGDTFEIPHVTSTSTGINVAADFALNRVIGLSKMDQTVHVPIILEIQVPEGARCKAFDTSKLPAYDMMGENEVLI